MKGLSIEDCVRWCSERGLVVTRRARVDFPHNRLTLSFEFEKIPVARVVALISMLLWDEQESVVNLVWISQRGIWNDRDERVGEALMTSIRRGGQVLAPLDKEPAVLTEGTLQAQAMALVPAIIGWNAYVIPDHARHFIFVSHDGVVSVVSSHARVIDGFQKDMESFPSVRYEAHPLDGPGR